MRIVVVVLVVKGLIPADAFGDAVSASKGKPRYGMNYGVQYSNQVSGRTAMTPLRDEKVNVARALATLRGAQAGAANAQANLANMRASAGGFAPRAEPKGTTPKRVSLTKAETAAMENQLADLAGTEFKKIDPQSRAAFISRATALTADSASNFHRNPASPEIITFDELFERARFIVRQHEI